MKKLIAIMAAIAVMASFGACGESNNSSETQTENGSVNVTEDNNAGEGAQEADDENEPTADNSPITEDDVRNHAETPAEDFEYVGGGYVNITGYKGSDPIVVIPEEINGEPVQVISGGFSNDSIVKGVKLPSGVKELDYTFCNNASLQVVLSDSIETVKKGTFNSNTNLKVVDLGNNVISFDVSNYFSTALERIHLPAGVSGLDKYVFESYGDNKDLTIIGEAGSYAETFANENGFNFEVG